MNRDKKDSFIKAFALLIIFTVVHCPNAYAYLDPGSGSLIIQMIVAALAAIALAVRVYWIKIKMLFSRNKKS